MACITLAGGQATRLGASVPKGTLPLGIGFNDWDSLLWIQAARILRLQKLAAEAYPGNERPTIQWCVVYDQVRRKCCPTLNQYGH